ncbi:67920586-b9aa-4731-a0d5-7b15c8957481 [Sclerotinia trifoliorum]|uniref:67920586-b9aa-4731-a0d5-7b15c8957481 n=1 Tax=Sclerotinia trifoliorum TaxID=28548 RepID=A0A8H2W0I9_9HELO|nr:67920586-b9aa-4731-a0d5-7b15c8957481 [Sclerotinia trifoliorum]
MTNYPPSGIEYGTRNSSHTEVKRLIFKTILLREASQKPNSSARENHTAQASCKGRADEEAKTPAGDIESLPSRADGQGQVGDFGAQCCVVCVMGM